MISDTTLQSDVLAELRSDPSLDASHIGVTVRDGVVALIGTVPSYTEKWAAERIAKRVYGVRGVAEELEVRLPPAAERTDADIARAAITSLKWHTAVPEDRIQVTVAKGFLKLEGKVDWKYQKDAAENAVRNLTGVKSVANYIETVAPRIVPGDVKEQIYGAFRRSAELDARRIGIQCRNGKVTLHGNVRSWQERQEAQRATWNVPGVREVENDLVITP